MGGGVSKKTITLRRGGMAHEKWHRLVYACALVVDITIWHAAIPSVIAAFFTWLQFYPFFHLIRSFLTWEQ